MIRCENLDVVKFKTKLIELKLQQTIRLNATKLFRHKLGSDRATVLFVGLVIYLHTYNVKKERTHLYSCLIRRNLLISLNKISIRCNYE